MKIKGFEWDSGNIAKCQKHGVSLDAIEAVFSCGEVWVMPDLKHSHKEERSIAIARVGGRYVFVVFTQRQGKIRPVSARFMHKDEVEYYEQETDR